MVWNQTLSPAYIWPLVTFPQSDGDTLGLTGDPVTISTGVTFGLTVFWTFFFPCGLFRQDTPSVPSPYLVLFKSSLGGYIVDCLHGRPSVMGLDIGGRQGHPTTPSCNL